MQSGHLRPAIARSPSATLLANGAYRGRMGTLEDALMLRSDGPDRWLAYADPDHESINAMFGGWTAAIALGSVMRSALGGASPSALTVNFIEAIAPDKDVAIESYRLGGGRSIEHWRADVRATTGSLIMASAMVVLTNRRTTDGHCQRSMPVAPDPETLEEFHAQGRQGQQRSFVRSPVSSRAVTRRALTGYATCRDGHSITSNSRISPTNMLRARSTGVRDSARLRPSLCRSTFTRPATRSPSSVTTIC
jgi:acyl-CoA thioesterase